MTRVVIDTNVFIRYLIKPSAAIRYLVEELWLKGKVEIVSSPELVAELEDVLAREYIQTLIRPEEGKALLDAVRSTADMLPPLSKSPPYTRDPKDDKFVACAIAGQAACLIALDKDILELKRVGNLEMVTPYDFAERQSKETG